MHPEADAPVAPHPTGKQRQSAAEAGPVTEVAFDRKALAMELRPLLAFQLRDGQEAMRALIVMP